MHLGSKRTYLDWAAAAPVSRTSREAFLDSLSYFGNPGALHTEARKAKELLEEARVKIARLAEVKEDGVIFTSGATEANALSILGSVRALTTKNTQELHVLYHPGAHASVVGTIKELEREGVVIEPLVTVDGGIDITAFKKQLRPSTVLVAIEAVCGETGQIYDTLGVRRALDVFAREQGKRVLLHVDASQAPRAESFTLAHLGADLVTLDAQKVGGVRGIGALLTRTGVELAPLMYGGGQEGGRRPGTESPMLATAFAGALVEVAHEREQFLKKSSSMRTTLLSKLGVISNMEVNEARENVPYIVNISLLGRDTDYAVLLLDAKGFAVSTKSACETDEEGSRAVELMSGSERARTTLRISWGPATNEQDLGRFASALIDTVRFLDEKAL